MVAVDAAENFFSIEVLESESGRVYIGRGNIRGALTSTLIAALYYYRKKHSE